MHFTIMCLCVLFLFAEYVHELLAGDGFLFEEVGGKGVHRGAVFLYYGFGLLVGVAYHGNHVAVYLGRGLGGAGKARIAAKLLIVHGFKRHHAEIVAHAVAGYHGAGKPGGLLNVV